MEAWKRKVGKDLLDQLTKGRSREHFRVLVQHNSGDSLPGILSRITVLHTMPFVGIFTASLTSAEVIALAKHRDIRFISSDRPVSTCLNIARPALGAQAAQVEGYDGEGIGVAVIDSGIYPHPDIEGALSAFVDFNDGLSSPYDLLGHGSHVSGIILGRGNVNPAYRGIAPGAKLLALKVFGQENVTSLGQILQALTWVHDHATQYNIRIVNMSLGASPMESYDLDPLCQAAKILWEKDILIIASVGNEGRQGARTVRTPGTCPYALTVGAMDDRRTVVRTDDTLAPFSSRGPTPDGFTKPDVVAPGVEVISLRAPGSTLDKQLPENRVGEYYFKLTGTSMAAPMASGLAALLLHKRPDLSPDEIKMALMATAEDRNTLAAAQGTGYVSALASLQFFPGVHMAWQGANLKVRFH